MFILRSTHDKLIAVERSRCDAVIAQMQEQISDLRRLVFVPTPTRTQEHPIRVVNAILDGQEVMPHIDPRKEAEDMAEANRILSGAYDHVEDSW